MKLNKYIFGTLICMTLFACEDFLELKPISDQTSENAYDKKLQIEAALIGAYESFQSDAYIWNNVHFQDVRSDNYYAGGDNPQFFEIDYLNITATNEKVDQSWSNIYNAILKANIVLNRINSVNDPSLTEERKNQIIGEATFLRAFHYYNLVNLFGEVPLYLEEVNSTEESKIKIPNSSVSKVYERIIQDLEDAAKLLPDTYGSDARVNKARATSGAAWALMAKAYAQRPNADYGKVLECIKKVEESKANYKLLNDFSQLFDGAHYNNEESILEPQWTAVKDGNWAPQMLLPPSISGDSWRKFVTPSKDLVAAFDSEGDDIRKNATILFEDVSWSDEYYGINTPTGPNPKPNTVAFAYKWKSANGWSSSNRQYFLRFADIVLLKAEALNETGSHDLAAAEVNKIRNRVNLPNLTNDVISDPVKLKDAILKERRLELAQEAQRWDDLVRYDKVVEVMNNLNEIDLRTGAPTVYNMTENKILLPIPQQELDRNDALKPNSAN